MSKKKISTKQRIISTAVRMYNESGIQKVTSRHIAAEMGISTGNLNYHYKNKEELLLAIYEQMRAEMSESYILRDKYPSSLEHLHRLLLHLEVFMYEYRFFSIDVVTIFRSYPKVNEVLRLNTRLRKQQMAIIIDKLVEEGFLSENHVKDYQVLQHTIRIIITFWLSQEEILEDYRSESNNRMSDQIWQLLLPYMTEKGFREYKTIVNNITV